MKKVLLTANWDWVLYNFRLPLARKLQESGLEVVLISPPGKYVDLIHQEGIRWLPWNLERRNTKIIPELGSIRHLVRIYRSEKPHVVHHFTVKPILYGSIAARLVGVPSIINNFTGLGYLFSDASKAKWLRRWVLPFLRFALNQPRAHTIFQTEHERRQFQDLRLIHDDSDAFIIAGTGVDLSRFMVDRDERSGSHSPAIFMAARLLWDKGVAEFVEAADLIKQRGVKARFWIAGERDPGNPACIPEDIIETWKGLGVVDFLGHRDDVHALLHQADVAVLPSYHEGVPLFLIEAAASGLPLVATDIEGCRMVVEDEVNGLLVPLKEPDILATAIHRILEDQHLRTRMGAASRHLAEERFDQNKILQQYTNFYREIHIL